MPVTLKTGVMKYRKSDGTYSVMDALMSEQTQDQIAAIETAGQEQVNAIEQTGHDILDNLPEDYTELEADVGGLKSAIDGNMVPDLTDTYAGYIQNPAVGSAISFKSSSVTTTIKKIIAVKEGYHYKVAITDSATPAATGSRDCAITDNNNIVRQIFSYTNAASTTSIIDAVSAVDGYLYIGVDNSYESIEINGGGVYNNKLAIEQLDERFSYEIADIRGNTKHLSEYELIRGNIDSSGKWANVTSGSLYCIMVPIEPGDSLKVTCSATYSNQIAFLKSNTAPAQGVAADFSASYTARITLSKGVAYNYTVPDDAYYLYIYKHEQYPSVEINGINLDTPLNTFIMDAYLGQKADAQNILELRSEIDEVSDSVDFTNVGAYPKNKGFINSEGNWSNINNTYLHIAIPVKSGDRILIIGNANSASYFAFLRTYSSPVSGAADFSQTEGYTARIQSDHGAYNWYDVPADTHYLIVQLISYSNDISPQEIRINNVNISVGIVGNLEELYRPIPVNWCALGDSITSSYHSEFVDGQPVTSTDDRENIAWAYLVSKINKWRLNNKAIGGTGYLDEGAGRCAWKLARATDFTPYNLVTISYGINDWKGNCVMGTISDDGSAETPTTVMGAMKATIEAIMASNPNCKIIVITPMNCYGYSKDYGDKSTNYGLGYAFSNSGTLESFCSKLIEVCNYYGIQYIDMTHYSPINRENLPTMVPDGVHPSIACHNMIAHQLSKQITF